jgi:hypothetical protein
VQAAKTGPVAVIDLDPQASAAGEITELWTDLCRRLEVSIP